MLKFLSIALLLCATFSLRASEAAAPGAGLTVDQAVALYNPDIFSLKPGTNKPVHGITDAFFTPASDIARDVSHNTLFNLLVFLPFLILPQILLIYIIFRFRKRNDGRKPATFLGNHALEIVWTAIPVLALVVVSVPVWHLLWKMELPPKDQEKALSLVVRGKCFAWDYQYQNEEIAIGQDVTGAQEPLVLEKDRVTILAITSNDVNHAWWVPSFGVKKDAVIGRFTNTWFTPDTLGVFKGQCAELCGAGHGIMFIGAVVVDAPQFKLWTDLQRRRDAAAKTWNALRPGGDAQPAELDAALKAYLAKDASPEARWALRFWIANHLESLCRKPPKGFDAVSIRAAVAPVRDRLDHALAAL